MTTRVKQPDEDDLKKLTRVSGYLKQTKNLKLTLGTGNEGLKISKWYMDGAHQVHEDLKGQNGAVLTFGLGGVYNTSNK